MNEELVDRLRGIAAKVTAGEVERTTVRQLLRWSRAERRTRRTVTSIRDALAQAGLRTQPDFQAVHPDHAITFVSAAEGDEDSPVLWPVELDDVRDALQRRETPQPITARTLLRWFGAERRGPYVVQRIREMLDELGLRTKPDFASAYIDAQLRFELQDATEAQRAEQHAPSVSAELVETVSPATDHIVAHVEPSTAEYVGGALDDAVLRVGMLPSADLASVDRELYKVRSKELLSVAITMMLQWDVAQLPVMDDDRHVRGMVSWRSIGTALALHKEPPKFAGQCLTPHHEVRHDASLLAAIPQIVEHECVLVRGPDGTITGIITTIDLALQFREQTEPFLLLGEIENQLRRLIDNKFTSAEIAAAANKSRSKKIGSVNELTFGAYAYLLRDAAFWERLEMRLDSDRFIQCIEEARIIRNRVMHFDPGAANNGQVDSLRRIARFLRDVQMAT